MRNIRGDYAEQPCCCTESIRVHTEPNNKESATLMAMDLLGNYAGYVRREVYIIVLGVNDMLKTIKE